MSAAAPDRAEMIYLESIRYNRKPALRTIVAGQRVPIELTSLGRAYLATLDAAARDALIRGIKRSYRSTTWKPVGAEIDAAIAQVHADGYCVASWQPGVVAMSTPLRLSSGRTMALNLSLTTDEPCAPVARRYVGELLALKDRIAHVLALSEPDTFP